MVDQNPFKNVNAPQQVNDTRRRYITEETTNRAIDAAPDARWRLIIALSRFGGLRIPSELVKLRWDDIDWESGRIRVPQPKLEHLPGGSFRIMPLFPRLRPYLEEQFELAEPGSEFVISDRRTSNVNLRTQFQRILRRAMIEPWPRLFHNLRASFQTDVCEQFPAHVAATWCGNSLATAEKHYLTTTEDHFRRATAEGIGEREKVAQNPTQLMTARAGIEQNSGKCQENEKAASDAGAVSCGHIRVSVCHKRTYEYPLGESNPCFRTENPTSWATRRRGPVVVW